MRAKDLDEAMRVQNAVDYGLTAGLHSLDSARGRTWLDHVEAGNLYVNRGITGAIVQRQPFGGWKRSAVGAGAKAGGPNYLFGLGEWVPAASAAGEAAAGVTAGLREPVVDALPCGAGELDADAFDRLHRGGGVATSSRGSAGVRRRFRRLGPRGRAQRASATARSRSPCASPTTPPWRAHSACLAAALRSGSPVLGRRRGVQLPSADVGVLRTHGIVPRIESRMPRGWMPARRRRHPARHGCGWSAARRAELCAAIGGSPDVAVWAHEPTGAGRVEMLPFLREQAVSITNHRFGNPTTLTDGVDLRPPTEASAEVGADSGRWGA